MEDLINEAIGYERNAFENDEPIDGGDLVEWFANWRERVAAKRQQIEDNSILAAAKECLEWKAYMGGWDAPCWERLRSAVEATRT